MALPVTYLFVPGNRPERFAKAIASGAGAVIIDLEDAVAPSDKAAARDAIAEFCAADRGRAASLLVRINDAATPWFEADLEFVRRSQVGGLMLPKAEDASQIERAGAALARGGNLIPIVESARGLLNVDALAEAPRVQRLAFGLSRVPHRAGFARRRHRLSDRRRHTRNRRRSEVALGSRVRARVRL